MKHGANEYKNTMIKDNKASKTLKLTSATAFDCSYFFEGHPCVRVILIRRQKLKYGLILVSVLVNLI